MALQQIDLKKRKDMIGCELKNIVERQEDSYKIGRWAFEMYDVFEYKTPFYEMLFNMAYMAEGDCFKVFSYEELDKFADELILSDESIPNGYAPECGYNEVNFGAELKRRVFRKDSIESLAKWALEIFIEMDYGTLYGMEDEDLKNSLLNLAAMIETPESAMSYEELDKLADDMILGRDIELK